MWSQFSTELQDRYAVKVEPEALQKFHNQHTDGSATTTTTSAELYRMILASNLRDVTAYGLLPRDIASQPAFVLKNDVLVQIQTSRDATQPLRPCADMPEEDAILGGANQRATNHRLLRLTVTDGSVEVPAIELSTLRVFNGIPTPGEKLLLKEGTEVRNGMVIMTDNDVRFVGGSEPHLRDEFLLRKHRALLGTQAVTGLEGAPKFSPLSAVVDTVRAVKPSRVVDARSSKAPNPQSNSNGPRQEYAGSGRGGSGHANPHRGSDFVSRGGRGRGSSRGGGRGFDHGDRGRGGGKVHHYDAHVQLAPAAVAAVPRKFTDADFPPLGGEW